MQFLCIIWWNSWYSIPPLWLLSNNCMVFSISSSSRRSTTLMSSLDMDLSLSWSKRSNAAYNLSLLSNMSSSMVAMRNSEYSMVPFWPMSTCSNMLSISWGDSSLLKCYKYPFYMLSLVSFPSPVLSNSLKTVDYTSFSGYERRWPEMNTYAAYWKRVSALNYFNLVKSCYTCFEWSFTSISLNHSCFRACSADGRYLTNVCSNCVIKSFAVSLTSSQTNPLKSKYP